MMLLNQGTKVEWKNLNNANKQCIQRHKDQKEI